MTQTTDGLLHAERESPAWVAAWNALRQTIITEGIGDGTDLFQGNEWGDGWQYMGGEETANGQTHTFRHRDHPATKVREYRHVQVPALSLVGKPEDVEF
jgi:hypothetical protein